MKGKRKGLLVGLFALCLACFSAFAACAGEEVKEDPVPLVSISITGKPDGAVALETGSLQLGILCNPENADKFSVKWTSNSQAVATVDASGLVTLRSAGRTTISASVIGNETIKDSFSLDVTSDEVAVESISITGKPEGEQVAEDAAPFRLSYEYLPENVSDFAVEWYSSTSSVATIDKEGLVTVVGKGVTTIRVTVKGTSVSDEFVLIVGNSVEVESVSIVNRPKNDELRQGSARQLSFTYLPADSAHFEVIWASSAPEIATVSSAGEIEALKVGETTITLSVVGTQVQDEFVLKVTEPLDPLCEDFETLVLAGSTGKGNYELIKNNYDGVTVTATDSAEEIPEGGSGTAVKVETSNNAYPGVQLTPSVLPQAGQSYSVSANVKMLEGATMLYCNVAFDGNVSTSFYVNIKAGESANLQGSFTAPADFAAFRLEIFAIGSANTHTAFTVDNVAVKIVPGVTIARPENDTAILEDKTLVLEAESNVSAEIVWTSSNTEVASFDGADGKLTLRAAGETLITATISVDGKEYKDTFTLKVFGTGIVVVNYPAKMKVGDSAQANIVVAGVIDGETAVTSLPEGVVSVEIENEILMITALSDGTAQITVAKGDYSDSFSVTVSSAVTEDFETASMSGNTIKGSFQTIEPSNSATLSLTKETEEIPENGSGQALKVTFAGKTGSYPGVNMIPAEKFIVGATYVFSAEVRAVSDVSMIYMKLEGKNDGANNANSGSLTAGQSKTITLELTVTKDQPSILLFIISKDGGNEAFTVDDVTIREKAQITVTNRPESDTILLQDGAYKLGYALLGGAQADTVTWTSSAMDVAEISQDGTVTPKAAGKTTITVAAGDYSFSFELSVKGATLLISEDFDGEFSVTQGDNWLGTGAQMTFSGAGFDMQHSENPDHIPAGGAGKCLFWQPWDGPWASLNFNNLPLESGNSYRLQFSAKLIAHSATVAGNFNVFIRYNDAQNTEKDIIVPVNFTAVGETVEFSTVLDLTSIEFSEIKVWLSAMTTSGTQISLDNFALYQL